MGVLSLRVVISVVSALSVATVAAITLSITLTSSLAALRNVGTAQAEALLRVAQLSSEGLFAVPQDAAEAMQNKSRAESWPNPSTSATTRQDWLHITDTLILQSHGRLNSIQTFFGDNSVALAGGIYLPTAPFQRPRPFTGYLMVYGTPMANASDPTAHASQTSAGQVIVVNHRGNRTRFLPSDPLYASTVPVVQYANLVESGRWDNTLMFATGGGRRNVNAGVFSGNVPGGVQSYFVFIAPMYRQGEVPGVDRPYAFAGATQQFSDMDDFLRATKATPGTLTVAFDRLGFLLASSAPEPTSVVDQVPFGTVPATGCTTTEATQNIGTQTDNFRACRVRGTDYGYPALTAALSKRDLAFTETRHVELLETDDGVYFAGAAEVGMRFTGGSIHLLILMPEVDVIGDVVASRNVAIGITVAVFVIVAAATFGIITVLLSPLHTIAERMQRAADFDDDGADISISAMSEVAALQRAYYEMNDELNRIRSFVPQSVLVAKRKHRDGDDPDLSTDLEESNTHTETVSVRSHRSQSTSRSKKGKNGAASVVSSAAEPETGALLLTARSVVVLVANVDGFMEQSCVRQHPSHMAAALATAVETVEETVSSNGGVLGSFHGDHFTVTFNAVKHCGAAPRRACTAADALRTSHALGAMHFQMGIAAGKCHVGNVGTASTKTFSVVGAAFTQAMMLERLSRLYGAGCHALVTSRVCQEVATQFRFRFVDHVVLPPRQPALIAVLQEPLETTDKSGGAGHQLPGVGGGGSDAEWLYVLQAQIAGDTNTKHNAAFQCLASNTRNSDAQPKPTADAPQQGQGIPRASPAASPTKPDEGGCEAVEDRLAALQARWHEATDIDRHGPTTDLGAFYAAFVRRPRQERA